MALKVIRKEYFGDESVRLRFLRETRAAASVRRTNVASAFHLGRTGEDYFYAMEFVEGETLEQLIKARVRACPILQVLYFGTLASEPDRARPNPHPHF